MGSNNQGALPSFEQVQQGYIAQMKKKLQEAELVLDVGEKLPFSCETSVGHTSTKMQGQILKKEKGAASYGTLVVRVGTQQAHYQIVDSTLLAHGLHKSQMPKPIEKFQQDFDNLIKKKVGEALLMLAVGQSMHFETDLSTGAEHNKVSGTLQRTSSDHIVVNGIMISDSANQSVRLRIVDSKVYFQ